MEAITTSTVFIITQIVPKNCKLFVNESTIPQPFSTIFFVCASYGKMTIIAPRILRQAGHRKFADDG